VIHEPVKSGPTVGSFGLAVLKFAATFNGPFNVIEEGLAAPGDRSPDQPVKAKPELATAETETTRPLSYQVVPEGVTDPPPMGLTDVVRLYWVLKLAVYVVLESGTVMV